MAKETCRRHASAKKEKNVSSIHFHLSIKNVWYRDKSLIPMLRKDYRDNYFIPIVQSCCYSPLTQLFTTSLVVVFFRYHITLDLYLDMQNSREALVKYDSTRFVNSTLYLRYYYANRVIPFCTLVIIAKIPSISCYIFPLKISQSGGDIPAVIIVHFQMWPCL